MRRSPFLLILVLSALVVIALPLSAGAKSETKSKKSVITKVSPMRAKPGATLTIRGKNFNGTRKRNTVIVKGAGGRLVFVKPRRASRHKLVLVLPSSVENLINGESTRMRLRVVVKRVYGKQSITRHSPRVLSEFAP